MTTSLPRVLCIIAAALPLAQNAAHAQVELRGGAFIEDAVVGVSPAGVEVRPAEGAPRTLGWDRVKRVAGDFEGDARAFERLADDLWRAASRLERGDVAMAAPIFDRLWDAALANEADPHTVHGVRLVGPTGLAIARGAAAVRVSQGRLPEAVEPWAASVALRRSLAGDAAADDGLLDPALPPVFVQSVATEKLARATPPAVVASDPLASALFDAYRAAAAGACGERVEVASQRDADAPAEVAFVRDIVAAQYGDDQQRSGVASRLREVVRQREGEWREAWARAGLGIDAVRHGEGRDRLAGALDLLHLPARFSSTQPYLAGLGLAWAAVALDAERDGAHAADLRDELASRYPSSPAIGWLARRAADGGVQP